MLGKAAQRRGACTFNVLIERSGGLDRPPVGLLEAFAVPRLQPRLDVAPLRAAAHDAPVEFGGHASDSSREPCYVIAVVGFVAGRQTRVCQPLDVSLHLLQVGTVHLRDARIRAAPDRCRLFARPGQELLGVLVTPLQLFCAIAFYFEHPLDSGHHRVVLSLFLSPLHDGRPM